MRNQFINSFILVSYYLLLYVGAMVKHLEKNRGPYYVSKTNPCARMTDRWTDEQRSLSQLGT